ncbi:hypothetical protein [Ferrimonas marina]|uniref:Uncharacterized protein n=1 Tax=Ferrimonas marina TaxID=299255 RepID=A0A1M5NPQ4_9GAMM|nr:hypothetical protein [Ferrimonas marina]SHG91169.1 hypothetical protein SAMN02745129_1126 [Ferrimonas marina]
MPNYLLIAVLAVIVYMPLRITYMVMRSYSLDSKQSVVAIAISWLIPVVGPLLIQSILKVELYRKASDSDSLWGQIWDRLFFAYVVEQHVNVVGASRADEARAVSDFSEGGGGEP